MILRALLIACVAQSTANQTAGPEEVTSNSGMGRLASLRAKIPSCPRFCWGGACARRSQSAQEPLLRDDDQEAARLHDDRENENENCASRCATFFEKVTQNNLILKKDPETFKRWINFVMKTSLISYIYAQVAVALRPENLRHVSKISMEDGWNETLLFGAFFICQISAAAASDEEDNRIFNPELAQKILVQPILIPYKFGRKIYNACYHNPDWIDPRAGALAWVAAMLSLWSLSAIYLSEFADKHSLHYADPWIARREHWDEISGENFWKRSWLPNMTKVVNESTNVLKPFLPPYEGVQGNYTWDYGMDHYTTFGYLRTRFEILVVIAYQVLPVFSLYSVKALLLVAHEHGVEDKGITGKICKLMTTRYTNLLNPPEESCYPIHLAKFFALLACMKLYNVLPQFFEQTFKMHFQLELLTEIVSLSFTASVAFAIAAIPHKRLVLPLLIGLMTLGCDLSILGELGHEMLDGEKGWGAPLGLLWYTFWVGLYAYLAGFLTHPIFVDPEPEEEAVHAIGDALYIGGHRVRLVIDRRRRRRRRTRRGREADDAEEHVHHA